jgi:hypothetical protein
VDLLPRDRIEDMLRDRCSGVSQSIKVEYMRGVPSVFTFRCGSPWRPARALTGTRERAIIYPCLFVWL